MTPRGMSSTSSYREKLFKTILVHKDRHKNIKKQINVISYQNGK